jgi:hypothetical protein
LKAQSTKNPCTGTGTVTPTFTQFALPSTYYTVKSIAMSGFSGCPTGATNGVIDTVVFDIPAAAYGLMLSNTTDSYFYKNVGSGIGTTACVHNDNSANTFVAMHCDDNFTNYEDAAGGAWYGTDCDSAIFNWHLVNNSPGSTATGFRSDGCHMYYDSSVQYPDATVYLIDPGVNNVSVGPDSLVASSVNPGYFPIVISGTASASGPILTPNMVTPPSPQGTLPSGFVSLGTPESSASYLTSSPMAFVTSVQSGVGASITLGNSQKINAVQGSSATSLMGATGIFTTGDLLGVGPDGSAVDFGPQFVLWAPGACWVPSTTTTPAQCAAAWQVPLGVTQLTRYTLDWQTTPTGCGTSSEYAIYDETAPATVATIILSNGSTRPLEYSGSLPKTLTPLHYLDWRLTRAAVGCTQNAINVSFTAQFN